jgi:hypothetical protein
MTAVRVLIRIADWTRQATDEIGCAFAANARRIPDQNPVVKGKQW